MNVETRPARLTLERSSNDRAERRNTTPHTSGIRAIKTPTRSNALSVIAVPYGHADTAFNPTLPALTPKVHARQLRQQRAASKRGCPTLARPRPPTYSRHQCPDKQKCILFALSRL